MVLIAPKLSDSTINSQLLKYFAKCQLDEMVGGVCHTRVVLILWDCALQYTHALSPSLQPGIRTNTNICLGKIATYLSPAVSTQLP